MKSKIKNKIKANKILSLTKSTLFFTLNLGRNDMNRYQRRFSALLEQAESSIAVTINLISYPSNLKKHH